MSELTRFQADIKAILEQPCGKALTAVNSAMVEANWLIGQRIVQEELQAQYKAQYGTWLMEALSIALTADFGKGFSYANLYNFRQFYRVFPDQQILYTLCRESTTPIRLHNCQGMLEGSSHNAMNGRGERRAGRRFATRCVANSIVARLAANSDESSAAQDCQRGKS